MLRTHPQSKINELQNFQFATLQLLILLGVCVTSVFNSNSTQQLKR